MVVNASNCDKIVAWVHKHLSPERANRPGHEIVFTDVSNLWAMFAIQGPKALDLLQPFVDADLQNMKYYRGETVRLLHPAAKRQGGIISRTGYTGEDGFELSLGMGICLSIWEALMEYGKSLGVMATGLGARDTLRLEAGMPLYGHELTEEIDPFQAGLGFACHLSGFNFPGRDALLKIEKQPPMLSRVGLELVSRRVPRQDCAIFSGGQRVGTVTSGSFSPTLQKSIAMGYVATNAAVPGSTLHIDIRGSLEAAKVVPIPFYTRGKKK
jgi:aminomethyltransferase